MNWMTKRSFERYVNWGEIHEYRDFEHFEHRVSNHGFHMIGYGTGYLDVYVEDKEAETTIVFFHAAMGLDGLTLPVFTGRNLMEGIEANAIYLSDPSLEFGLGLGWYAGDSDRPLQQDLPRVLGSLISRFSKHKHLVFFGASGGGFASLFYGSLFSGALSVCVNPQVNIFRYLPGAYEPYLEACWPEERITSGEFVSDVSVQYCGGRAGNTVLYLQNLGDASHIRDQLLPWLEKEPQREVEFFLHLGQWGKGHRAPSVAVLKPLLETAIAARGNWARLDIDVEKCLEPELIRKKSVSYLNSLKK